MKLVDRTGQLEIQHRVDAKAVIISMAVRAKVLTIHGEQ